MTTTTAPENVDGFRAYLYGHSRTMTESGVQDILGQMRSVCQEAPDRFQLFMALQLDEGRAEFSFTKEGVAYLCPHRLAEVDEVERATTGG